MSNLIVTILAIGMAAIVTVAGAFYAGNAFLSSFYKAQAAQLINYLGSYAQAANVWSQRNGGTLPEPASNLPVTASATTYFAKADLDSFFVPRFLQANNLPSKFVSSSTFYYQAESAPASMKNPVMVGFLGAADVKICDGIEAMRTGAWPASLRTYSSSSVNTGFCGNIGCLTNDGTFGSTGTYTYIIYYRVHGVPNSSAADVNPSTCT